MDSSVEDQKREAAVRAADWVEDGMRVGLGTGSTVRHLLTHLAERRRTGEWANLVCVPTSEDTASRARALGIPLATLEACPRLDLTIDGADEVDPQLRLIKGLGAALLREKIVASVSDRLIIVADESKRVLRLGTRGPVPVEVDPFGTPVIDRYLRSLGAEPALRRRPDGSLVVTDGGNHILDCTFADGIDDPEGLEVALALRPGIVESGLFLGMADAVVFAGADGTEVLLPQGSVVEGARA